MAKQAVATKERKTRKAQVEETKLTILDAAVELFLEDGYKVASLNILAKRISCSKETIYKYFTSKEGLFLAAIDKILDDILIDVVDLDIQHMALRDGLEQASYKTLEKLCTERYIRLRSLIIANAEDMPKIGKEYYEYIEERSYKILAKFLKNHIDKNTLKDIDATRMAKYFWSMMLHNLLFQLSTKTKSKITKREIKSHANQVIDDFLLVFSR